MKKRVTSLVDFIIQKISGIPNDKLLHFSTAAILTAVLKLILPWLGVLFVCTFVFIAKEAYDKRTGKGTPELKDIIADYLGFVIGIL